jgi:hypothetical protein
MAGYTFTKDGGVWCRPNYCKRKINNKFWLVDDNAVEIVKFEMKEVDIWVGQVAKS